LLIHLILTFEVSLIAWLKSGSVFSVLAAFLGGILIDIDHLIDYFIHFRKLELKSLLAFPYQQTKSVYLIFHSWELVILVGVFSFFYPSLLLRVFVFSWGLHLFVDNIDGFKRKGFNHYFFLFRLAKGFSVDKLKGFIPT